MNGKIRLGQRDKYVYLPYPECGYEGCSADATVSISKNGVTKHRCTEHVAPKPTSDTEVLLKRLGLL